MHSITAAQPTFELSSFIGLSSIEEQWFGTAAAVVAAVCIHRLPGLHGGLQRVGPRVEPNTAKTRSKYPKQQVQKLIS